MSENRLSALMERIIRSDYILMEELVEGSDSYSIDEIRVSLDRIITAWGQTSSLQQLCMHHLSSYIYTWISLKSRSVSRIEHRFRFAISPRSCFQAPCFFTHI